MVELLKGAPVAAAILHRLQQPVEQLRAAGITPTLAIVRVGQQPEDIAYENSAARRCGQAGIAVQKWELPAEADTRQLLELIGQINQADSLHGCLLLRPLPRQVDEQAVCRALDPAKDVDGVTPGSLAGVFAGLGTGFAPCTAQACLELLAHYGCPLEGRRAVVIGRSLVVGRPAAMLLLHKNATVTLCHSRTRDLPALCRQADILVVAAGQAGLVGPEHLADGQVVVDVGIHADGQGKLCGDVQPRAAQGLAVRCTPVPGGVGGVTSAVLALHVVQAACRAAGLEGLAP